MKRLLPCGLTLVSVAMGVLGCGGRDPSPIDPIAQTETTSAESKPSPPESPPPLDLSKVTGYEVTILAAHGKPIAGEELPVEEIEQWSLNGLGQIAFLATKDTPPGGHVATDLYLVDQGTTKPLAMQRHEGEHTGQRFSSLASFWLNDVGQVLVNGFREHNWEDVQLFLFQRDQIIPCSIHAKHLETVWRRPKLRFGPQEQLCYLFSNRESNEGPAICAGTLANSEPVLIAANDPSDPLRQCREFSGIYGTNSRGQILFTASVGRDHHSGQRLFLYTAPDKSPDAKASGDQKLSGTVREIARPGGRLSGTKINLANAAWSMAALSERGDVVMVAQTARPGDTTADKECLFVLRPDQPWKMVAAPDGHPGDVKLPVSSVTHPTINARGQVAFVADFLLREEGRRFDERLYDERLFRLEPDDTLTELAHIRQTLKTGEKLIGLHGGRSPGTVPLILSGGQVVVQPTLNIPQTYGTRVASILIVGDGAMFEALRLPAQLPEPPKVSEISIEEIRANDAGYLGVVYSNESHPKKALLLAKPKYGAR